MVTCISCSVLMPKWPPHKSTQSCGYWMKNAFHGSYAIESPLMLLEQCGMPETPRPPTTSRADRRFVLS